MYSKWQVAQSLTNPPRKRLFYQIKAHTTRSPPLFFCYSLVTGGSVIAAPAGQFIYLCTSIDDVPIKSRNTECRVHVISGKARQHETKPAQLWFFVVVVVLLLLSMTDAAVLFVVFCIFYFLFLFTIPSIYPAEEGLACSLLEGNTSSRT
jgi:hypothetical protein